MISIKNVSKEYINKRQSIRAINDVSIEVEKGESLAILGLNGSGKSTLVNMITGIITPTEGEVSIKGLKPTDGKCYRKQFSVVYQNNGLDFYLSVYENLKTNGFIYGLRGKALSKAIDDIMDVMDLQKYKKSKINELSGGYAKRVQVAKALMIDTPVIILDEPTHGMDPLIKKRLFEMLNKRKEEGKVILYTTQILDEVEKICNEVAILKSGDLISKDSVQNTKQRFSQNNVLEIAMSDTQKSRDLSSVQIRKTAESNNIRLNSLELNEHSLKIITKSEIDQLIHLSNELNTFIDIEELVIKKASLEEILLAMEGE